MASPPQYDVIIASDSVAATPPASQHADRADKFPARQVKFSPLDDYAAGEDDSQLSPHLYIYTRWAALGWAARCEGEDATCCAFHLRAFSYEMPHAKAPSPDARV